MLIELMSKLKPLYELLGRDDTTEELYSSDQKYRKKRQYKGLYSRQKGLFNFLLLIKEWEEIVGPLMAKNTIPLKIKGTTLLVSTKHSIFAQELGFLVPKLIEKITEKFPETINNITNIKFIHSDFSQAQFMNEKKPSLLVNKKKQTLHPYSPEYQYRKKRAEELFKDIEDEEIRKALSEFYLK
jgi:hypothetical protein